MTLKEEIPMILEAFRGINVEIEHRKPKKLKYVCIIRGLGIDLILEENDVKNLTLTTGAHKLDMDYNNLIYTNGELVFTGDNRCYELDLTILGELEIK